MNKRMVWKAIFSRGNGSCAETEVRIFFADTDEEAKAKSDKYAAQYFEGWDMWINEILLDEDGFGYTYSVVN